jgi:thiol:disulfide interchange protein DsbD
MPRPTMLLLTVLLIAALALYLAGTYRLPHDMPGQRRAVSFRTLAAVGAVLAVLYLSRGLTGRELDAWTEAYLPPHGYGRPAGEAPAERIAWVEDLQAARAAGAATGRNLFLDFTGVTCVNCRIVEKSIFSQERFGQATEAVVPVRLYTDRRSSEHAAGDETNRRLMERLGSVTLPLYVLMAPDGTVLRRMGYSPDFTVDDFVRFLEDPLP